MLCVDAALDLLWAQQRADPNRANISTYWYMRRCALVGKMVPVADPEKWNTFPGNLVCVELSYPAFHRGLQVWYNAHISVYDADDTILQREFQFLEEAREYVVKMPPYLSIEGLFLAGFTY